MSDATPTASPGGLHETRVDLPDITLNVATAGPDDAERTVLLLHGFPDSWHLWRHQLPVLVAAGYRVVAPDLRGYGLSDRPDAVEAYAMPRLVADVADLLDHVGAERADLVAHDWGAGVAWSAAMRLPQRVRSLVTVSVGHGATSAAAGLRQRELSWYMLWFLFPGVAEEVLPADDWAFFRQWGWGGADPADDPDLARQIADLSRPGALTAALSWYRANISPRRFVPHGTPPGTGRPVTCPVTGVWSSDDPFLGERQMTASSDVVAGPWRYERVEGVDHWVPVHAPDRLSRILLEHLGLEHRHH